MLEYRPLSLGIESSSTKGGLAPPPLTVVFLDCIQAMRIQILSLLLKHWTILNEGGFRGMAEVSVDTSAD